MPVTCYAQTLSKRQILWPTVAMFRQALVHPLQSKITGILCLEHLQGLGEPLSAVHEALGLALPCTFADLLSLYQNNDPSAGCAL